MRNLFLILASSMMLAAPAAATPAEDATRTVTGVLDKFNAGDINAFFAAHETSATIVDEIAPFSWTGANAVQHWAADYAKDAARRGISGGRVEYGRPLQAISDGAHAYIVLPAIYRFKQSGKRMAGKGSMTFLMNRHGETWKIASWAYSGATARPQ